MKKYLSPQLDVWKTQKTDVLTASNQQMFGDDNCKNWDFS